MAVNRPLVWTAAIFAAGAWWGVENGDERAAFAAVGGAAAIVAFIAFFLTLFLGGGLRSFTRIIALVAVASLGSFLGANAVNPPLPENHIARRIASYGPSEADPADGVRASNQDQPATATEAAISPEPRKGRGGNGTAAGERPHKKTSPRASPKMYSKKECNVKEIQPGVVVQEIAGSSTPQSTEEAKPRRREKSPPGGAAAKALRVAAMIGKGDSRLPGHAAIKALRAAVKIGRVLNEVAEEEPGPAPAPEEPGEKQQAKKNAGRIFRKALQIAVKHSEIIISSMAAKGRSLARTAIVGRLVQSPMRHSDRTVMVIEAERVLEGERWEPVCGRVMLTVMRDVPRLVYGDRVFMKVAIKGTDNFRNPGGFDYRLYLATQGIFARGALTSGKEMAVLREWPPEKPGPRAQFEGIRQGISEWIGREGENGPVSEVMRALVVGDRWAAPEDVNDLFQRAGVAHLLAVSGLHLGLVAGMVYWLTITAFKASERVMLAIDARRVAALATIPPVIAYMLLAGARIPTIRAAIMVCVYMIAVAIGRDDDLLSAIAIAALAILVIWPASIVDVGFILSFCAVIAIFFVMPLIRHVTGRGSAEEKERLFRRFVTRITSGLILSAGIVLFTSPFVARYFNYFIPIAPISNLIFIPLVGNIALPLGLVASMLHAVWPAGGDWLMYLGLRTLDFSIWLMKYFARLSAPDRLVPAPTVLETVIVMLLTVVAARALGREGRARLVARLATLVLVLALVADGGVWYLLGKGRGDLRITYLDVGEGSAAVVVTPVGKTLVVDTGPGFAGFNAGERIVAPFLLHERITRIDAIAITHPHSDHVGGLAWLLDHFRVGEIWMADAGYPENDVKLITSPAAKKGTLIRRMSKETAPFGFGGVWVDVWWPPRGADLGDVNDMSLVLRLKFGDASFLFPGDAGEQVQGTMLGLGGDYHVTTLLAPHHGARDGVTDALLMRLKPEWAVISSRYSSYNRFPSPEALAALKRARIPAFRTDEMGAIGFRTDGVRMEVRAWDGRHMRRVVQ